MLRIRKTTSYIGKLLINLYRVFRTFDLSRFDLLNNLPLFRIRKLQVTILYPIFLWAIEKNQNPGKLKSNIVNRLFFLLSLTCPFLLSAQNDAVSLPPSSSFSSVTGEDPATIQLTYRIENNRIFLNWAMDSNQDTNQFELERSSDGKNFVLAALVFGTDKPGTEDYRFYEKARSKKTFYRVKIIRKDRTADYSDIILTKKEGQ